jgi:hypothetical protein
MRVSQLGRGYSVWYRDLDPCAYRLRETVNRSPGAAHKKAPSNYSGGRVGCPIKGATVRIAIEVAREMAEGTFVPNTDPINMAREVDALIRNFGFEDGAAVAAQMADIDRNDADRVSDGRMLSE